MSKTHYLKTTPPYFQDIYFFKKSFECRYNDRDYQVGDIVYLQEYLPDDNTYTGREIKIKITYIMKEFEGLKDNWVIFSFVQLK